MEKMETWLFVWNVVGVNSGIERAERMLSDVII